MTSIGGFCFSLLLVSLVSVVLSNNLSALEWSKQYKTSTKDVALSIALDGGNGFVYIVGRTTGPRGMNESFPGLVYNNAMKPGNYDASKAYQDAIIVRVAKQDGRVDWASRLLLAQASGFSAVALSQDGSVVYAAGTATVGKDDKPFIIQKYDANTGKEKGHVFKAGKKSNYMISSIAVAGDDVFLCGRSSQEVGVPLQSALALTGGIIVGKVSKSKKIAWLRQAGENMAADMCSGLTLSEDKKTAFLAGTSHSRRSDKQIASSLVIALSTTKGEIVWRKNIQISADTDLRSSGILATTESIYVLTHFWSGTDNLRKSYLHKLSSSRGTLLWSKETCCTSVLNREAGLKSFEGMGSATPIPGLGFAADKYVYHLVSYRRREELLPNTYSTNVVRVGEYGEQVPKLDISDTVYSFRITPSAPKRALISTMKQGIYVLSNKMPTTAESISMSLPTLQYLSFNQSSTTIVSRPVEGVFYINVSMTLNVSTVEVGAVSDLLAERIRISPSQVGFTSNQTLATVFRPSQVTFWMKLYGGSGDMSTLYEGARNELASLFLRTEASKKNVFERHFGLGVGAVQLQDGSISMDEEGLSATAADDGTKTAKAHSSLQQTTTEHAKEARFQWKVFGISAACLSFVVLIAGGLFYMIKQRNGAEESFVASSFHGRPAASSQDRYF